MDILKYSALNAINKTTSNIANANTLATLRADTDANVTFTGLGQTDANNWQANGTTYVASQTHLGAQWCNGYNHVPWCNASWGALVPRMPGSTGTANAGINYVTGNEYCGFKVCAPNFYGANSSVWTVPSGAQYARFQIWGAGGSAGSGCCCGGSTWGTSGAYASVIIPVTPGNQYTLCAGCARACPTLWGSNLQRGCMSFVTGAGLCNFCAEGAPAKDHRDNLYLDMGAYSASGWCWWAAPWCWAAGACLCNTATDFCFAGSCASCGVIGFSRSVSTTFYGCYTGSFYTNVKDIDFSKGMQVVGLPGLNGSMCWDTSFYGQTCAPPVYGYESTTCSCICFNSGSTMGGLCCNHVGYTYRRAPGAGATASLMYGGCTATTDPSGLITLCGGDIGRSGMVCVTWF